MFPRCSLVPTKKGNYTFSISTLEFAVPIDSAVPSRTLSWISVFNSTGEEIDHAGSVISVLAGASLTLVVHLVDAFGVEVNTELLKDSVVVNVISYEDGNPVGFLFFLLRLANLLPAVAGESGRTAFLPVFALYARGLLSLCGL